MLQQACLMAFITLKGGLHDLKKKVKYIKNYNIVIYFSWFPTTSSPGLQTVLAIM